MRRTGVFLQLLAIVILIVIVIFPICMAPFVSQKTSSTVSLPLLGPVVLQTIYWSLSVGILSTTVGWFVGLRIATLRSKSYARIVIALMMSLAIPAYAIYYAWWQSWPAGTWVHEIVVKRELLPTAMQACLLAALVGWSWPIPALVVAMARRTGNSIQLLHQLDHPPLLQRILHRLKEDRTVLLASIILVAVITSANTTCFDLAQVPTIGNELRALLATGGSVLQVPWLLLFGLLAALLGSFLVLRVQKVGQRITLRQTKSTLPVLIVWLLLTGLPLAMSAISSLFGDGFQLWSQYKGDLFVSATIAFFVGLISALIVITTMSLYATTSRKVMFLGNTVVLLWLGFACLPAGIVASAVGNAWHFANIGFVERGIFILVFGLVARIGFVGALAGRWVASCPRVRILHSLDKPNSIFLMLRSNGPRLIQGIVIAIAISIAMAFGEVALTTQLAPPSSSQPISIALLHAMHYQRPQIVTSALFLIISIAALGWIVLFVCNRKVIVSIVLCCVCISCQTEELSPIQSVIQIGSVGQTDGHFLTPRAIDANKEVLVVIDKSGRLQRFTPEGVFLSSWDLDLSGTGFPTGVSIDADGNIWIADTHQHRVLVLDQFGNEILTIGEYGTGQGQFLYPTDIAFGLQGEVFVSEYGGNDRISVFDTKGTFLRSIGEFGEGRTGFRRPQSMVVDPNTGNIYVSDSGNHRIVVLHPDGEVIDCIAEVGRGESELLYPYSILMDSAQTLLICEYGNNRLQRFTLDGDSIGTWGSAGSDVGLLRTPWCIAKTRNGIVIADTGNHRLQVLPDMMGNQ